MRKRAHAEALPICVVWGTAGFPSGGRPAKLPPGVSPTAVPPTTERPFAASFVHLAAGPLLEEAVRAQGHRGAPPPDGVEEAKRTRGGGELEDFASNDEEEEVSSNEEPTPRPTSPMTRWWEWPSGHNEGLPQPGIGRQPAHEMLGWQHFGKREVEEKGVWTLARRPDSSARCPNSKTRAVVSNSLQ